MPWSRLGMSAPKRASAWNVVPTTAMVTTSPTMPTASFTRRCLRSTTCVSSHDIRPRPPGGDDPVGSSTVPVPDSVEDTRLKTFPCQGRFEGGGCLDFVVARWWDPSGSHHLDGSGGRPGLLDLLGDLCGGLVAAGPLDHAGPERAPTHLGRHQVGGVETEDVGLRGDLTDLPGGLVRVQRRVEGGVRREPPAVPGPGFAKVLRGEHLHHLGGLLVVGVERRGEVTTTPHRVAVVTTIDWREVEDVYLVVKVLLDIVWEEAGDEVALTLHHAPRRVLEGRVARLGERRVDHGLRTATDVPLGQHDFAVGVERFLHHRVIERDLVVHPLVVDLRTVQPEHELLDPVRADPAGRRVGAVGDAPWRRPRSLDLLSNLLELLHRGRLR